MRQRIGSSALGWIFRNAILLVFLLLLLVACTFPPSRPYPQSQDIPVFVAPTVVVIQPVAQQTVQSTQFTATTIPTSSVNQPNCVDDLTYINDLNYPDGTNVSHGSIIQKQWLVQNTGTCTWAAGYTVRKIDGPEMSANPSQSLTSSVPGSQVTISITFIAPTQPGEYKSTWQAFNPGGQSFGKFFYIDIIVSQ